MIKLQDEAFDPGALLSTFCRGRAEVGAVASFTGLARAEAGAATLLELEAYPGFTDAEIGKIAETGGRLGFITPLSHNFCDACNRVRLTCTGTLHTCLGQEDATDLRSVLRAGASDQELEAVIRGAILAKPKGHDFQIARAAKPAVARHMSTTGG